MSMTKPSRSNYLPELRTVLILGIPSLLGLALVFSFIYVRYSPPPINAALAKISQNYRVLDDTKNGFYFLRGLDVASNLDPFSTGLKISQAEMKRFAEDPIAYESTEHSDGVARLQSIRWTLNRCADIRGNCLDQDLQQRAAIEKNLQQNSVLFERYAALKTYPEFEEHVPASYNFAPIPYRLLGQINDMRAVSAAFHILDGEVEHGLSILEDDFSFQRHFLQYSGTNLSRIVALKILERKARTINDFISLRPKLASQHRARLIALLAPLNKEERDLSAVLAHLNQYREKLSPEDYSRYLKRSQELDTYLQRIRSQIQSSQVDGIQKQ